MFHWIFEWSFSLFLFILLKQVLSIIASREFWSLLFPIPLMPTQKLVPFNTLVYRAQNNIKEQHKQQDSKCNTKRWWVFPMQKFINWLASQFCRRKVGANVNNPKEHNGLDHATIEHGTSNHRIYNAGYPWHRMRNLLLHQIQPTILILLLNSRIYQWPIHHSRQIKNYGRRIKKVMPTLRTIRFPEFQITSSSYW